MENRVSLVSKDITIHVLDIDAALTKEDVEKAIGHSLGNSRSHTVKVSSIRPSRDGNQIATVQVNKVAGNILIKLGKVKIGWVGCRVRERVEITRCFKCLEFGHRRHECKGADKSNLCLKCNQPGHKAKDCQGKDFCPACRDTGHPADSTKCPKFRELLKVQSASRRVSKEANTNHENQPHEE
ncbi:Zinc knuckle [Popillia japonica]|uniref:Zinc knuckle n=1 Tax=Popillia japonica TaxID=7064 RepID=A0AAW1LE69_POPJA